VHHLIRPDRGYLAERAMGLIERLSRERDECDPEPEYLVALRAAYLRVYPASAPVVIARNEYESEWVKRAHAGELPVKDYTSGDSR
jgi:hypothetical protein